MRALFIALMLSGAPLMAGPVLAQQAVQDTATLEAARRAFVAGRHAEALAVLRPAAEAGDPLAQNVVGAAYDDGAGYAVDPIEAERWYRRSAEAGFSRAQMNLAQILRDGRPGIAPDPVESRRWMQASADQGYAPAMAGLGRMYERGIGGPTDLAEALRLYERGRAGGSDWAVEYLAHLYLNGSGVVQDEARARALFLEAANLGLAQSLGNYGYMLEMGTGGPQDLEGAQTAYRGAMEQGYARAGYNLAWVVSGAAVDRAGFAEAAQHCDWALERASPANRTEWAPHCATMRKWVLLY